MLEDAPNTDLPPRSRLFSLPMMGQCGATQESLLDYACRVSVAHSITPRRMLSEIIFPALPSAKNPGTPKALGPSDLLPINGSAETASEFVSALEQMTGRSGLARGTLLSWGGLLSQKASFARTRRWCPLCLEAQGNPRLYSHSLLWTLEVVTICPIHNVALTALCEACGRDQPVLGAAHLHASCAHCGSSLTSGRKISARSPTRKESFIAESVAELIATGSESAHLADWNLLRMRLLNVARNTFEGSIPRMAKRLNVANSLLYLRSATSLWSLLEVTYRLGVKPLDLLSGSARICIAEEDVARRFRRVTREHEDVWKAREARLTTEVRNLATVQNETVVLADVARRVGARIPVLERRFPEAIRKLREHNDRYRALVRQVRIERRLTAARQAMQTLVGRGALPTTKSVQSALREHGIRWRLPETDAAARAELVRLGVARSSCARQSAGKTGGMDISTPPAMQAQDDPAIRHS